MFQGNWTCSGCGGAITELPFEPRSAAGLTCRTCYAKSKNPSAAAAEPAVNAAPDEQEAPDFTEVSAGPDDRDVPDDGATSVASGERKMFTGDWQCAGCGGSITQLPFQPRETGNLRCLDCFKKSKG